MDELDGSGGSEVDWTADEVCNETGLSSSGTIAALGDDFTISAITADSDSDGVEITVPTIEDGEIGQTTCDFDFDD